MKRFVQLFVVFCFLNSLYSNELKYELVVDKLEVPWAFVFLPDNSILITERKGELIHFKNGVRNKIKNLPEIISKNLPKNIKTFHFKKVIYVYNKLIKEIKHNDLVMMKGSNSIKLSLISRALCEEN